MTDQALVDKTMRSVFVGNIPYEVSEEKLKDIFSEVGLVLSFKLVFDRDSGKPKGYGFCEYKDQETALCAMRNLNNYEIAGRNLRVDNACTEKSRLEMQSLMQSTQVESSYGESISPDKAPEAVCRVVASLPPELMFELLKQVKSCIQNDPAESRQMLLQNPQLSYALLQIMVTMKVIDNKTAASILHPANDVPSTLALTSSEPLAATAKPVNGIPLNNSETHSGLSADTQHPFWSNNSKKPSAIPAIQPPPMPPPMSPMVVSGQKDLDLRSQPVNRFADQDLRNLSFPNVFPPTDTFKRDPRLHPQMSDNLSFQGMVPPGMMPANMQLPMPIPGTGVVPMLQNMSRLMAPPSGMSIPNRPVQIPNHTPLQPIASSAANPPIPSVGSNIDKANLIMKVLRLSDDEISQMPPEQRQTILALKDQLAKSSTKK